MLKIKSLSSSSTNSSWHPTYLCPWQSNPKLSCSATHSTVPFLFNSRITPRLNGVSTSVYRVHHSLGFGGSASTAAVIRQKSGRFARICASRHKNGHRLNSVPGSVMKSSQRVEGKSSSIKYHSLLITHPCSSHRPLLPWTRNGSERNEWRMMFFVASLFHPLPHSAVVLYNPTTTTYKAPVSFHSLTQQ